MTCPRSTSSWTRTNTRNWWTDRPPGRRPASDLRGRPRPGASAPLEVRSTSEHTDHDARSWFAPIDFSVCRERPIHFPFPSVAPTADLYVNIRYDHDSDQTNSKQQSLPEQRTGHPGHTSSSQKAPLALGYNPHFSASPASLARGRRGGTQRERCRPNDAGLRTIASEKTAGPIQSAFARRALW